MPITTSAKKAMRQAEARLERRKPYKSRLKTEVKKVMTLVKTDLEKAKKALPAAYSVIDTAAKKHVIHKNTANRKKALLAKLVAKGPAPTAAPKSKKTAAKTTGKKTAKKKK